MNLQSRSLLCRVYAMAASVLLAVFVANTAAAVPTSHLSQKEAPRASHSPANRTTTHVVPSRTVSHPAATPHAEGRHEEAPRMTLGQHVKVVAVNAAYGLEANFVGTIATGLALSPNHEIHIDPAIAGTFWVIGTTVATLYPSVSKAVGNWWSSLKKPKGATEGEAGNWAKTDHGESLFLVDGEAVLEIPEVQKREHSPTLTAVKRELSSIGYGLKLAAVINAIGMPICYLLYGTEFSPEGTAIFVSATLVAPYIRNALVASVKKVASFFNFKRSKPAPTDIIESWLDLEPAPELGGGGPFQLALH